MLTMHLRNLEYFSVFGVGLVRHTATIKTGHKSATGGRDPGLDTDGYDKGPRDTGLAKPRQDTGIAKSSPDLGIGKPLPDGTTVTLPQGSGSRDRPRDHGERHADHESDGYAGELGQDTGEHNKGPRDTCLAKPRQDTGIAKSSPDLGIGKPLPDGTTVTPPQGSGFQDRPRDHNERHADHQSDGDAGELGQDAGGHDKGPRDTGLAKPRQDTGIAKSSPDLGIGKPLPDGTTVTPPQGSGFQDRPRDHNERHADHESDGDAGDLGQDTGEHDKGPRATGLAKPSQDTGIAKSSPDLGIGKPLPDGTTVTPPQGSGSQDQPRDHNERHADHESDGDAGDLGQDTGEHDKGPRATGLAKPSQDTGAAESSPDTEIGKPAADDRIGTVAKSVSDLGQKEPHQDTGGNRHPNDTHGLGKFARDYGGLGAFAREYGGLGEFARAGTAPQTSASNVVTFTSTNEYSDQASLAYVTPDELGSTASTQISLKVVTHEAEQSVFAANSTSAVETVNDFSLISHTTNGSHSAPGNVYGSEIVNNNLRALSLAQSGGNGVYAYGASGLFPTNSFNSADYVDVAFRPQLVG
jgi:hypothetical protein